MKLRSAVLVLSAAGVLYGQSKTSSPPVPNNQWIALFDGKNLDQWEPVGKEKWDVVDGSIHGQTLTKAYGYLQTRKSFRDFELSLRYKCIGDGNSGVFFHTAFKTGTVDVSQGLQFEIDPNVHHHTGGIYGDGREWIVWPAPEFEQVMHPHDWNDYLLTVQGNHYKARLNGVLIVDFTDPKPLSHDGTIALQMHMGGGGEMLFQDIYIRDITPR